MPVFKIKKDGVWQEVAGVSGHTHNVNQIVDLPHVTPADTGKFLCVSEDGAWELKSMQFTSGGVEAEELDELLSLLEGGV